ncbi:MAG TPA: S8 family serine peptidase [Thermoanaerobaculia bacterium]
MADETVDRFGRPIFTGRALVAVTLDRPTQYIATFVRNLLLFVPPLLGFDSNRDFLSRSDVFPSLGTAVLPIAPDVLRAIIASHHQLEGVTVGRERYLYPPHVITSDSGTSTTPLARMKVREDHAGKVSVAVLDTGLDEAHPDLSGRKPIRESFVANAGPEDRDGHGTHCVGLACGIRKPSDGGLRYGVAPEASIYSGRVMGAFNSIPADGTVMHGLCWAQCVGAVVVNMSFGASVAQNADYDAEFERTAFRLREAGLLMVAAAGNDADGKQYPVKHPANCPSVMAVAALDDAGPWAQSCIGSNTGQDIDVAAPGVAIRSSALGGKYEVKSGTSMAAAYVSGIAALWADTPKAWRGRDLWDQIVAHAVSVSGKKELEGAGIVQAP